MGQLEGSQDDGLAGAHTGGASGKTVGLDVF